MSAKSNNPETQQDLPLPAPGSWLRDRPPLEGGKRGPVPPVIRGLAQQMLAEGASPEEVVAMSRRQGSSRITLATVKHWMDRNPAYREIAIRRQVAAAEELKKSLAAGETSPAARLAEAALLAGLAQTPKGSSHFDLRSYLGMQTAMSEQLERENAALRRRARKLEARKESILRRIARTEMRLEHVRWQVVQRQLRQLRDELDGARETNKFSRPLADTVRRLLRLAGASR